VPAVLLAVLVLAALPAVAAAKTIVYGVRTYKPPPSLFIEGSYTPHPSGSTHVQYGRRELVARHPGAFPARALPAPRPVEPDQAHASSASLYVGAGFPGLVDNGYYPSDAQVAAGPSDIVEMTNTMTAIYSRSGFTLAEFPMTKILGTGNSDSLSDPQIAWDQTTGRWIATAMDLTTDATEVSVSNTADPVGGWFNYGFPFGSKLCPDQPRLGFSSTVVVVATELFTGNCHSDNESVERGAVMIVVDKAAMLADAPNPPASEYGPDPAFAHFVPVQMLAASPIEYVASTDDGSSKFVHVFADENAPPNDVLTEQDSPLIRTLRDPTMASERGGGLIDAGEDDRINDASWENGVLYLAADDRCSYPGDPYLETCARIMEISTTGAEPTLIGENDIGFPDGDAYYAAIRPDLNGDLVVVFGYSNPNSYPSIAATAAIGPIVGEQGGTFLQPEELAGGTSPTVERWGDYSGAAIDPTNPSIIWTAGQVADDIGSGQPYRWATHIDSLSLLPSIPAELPHEVDPGYQYKGLTTQREPITIRPAGGGAHIKTAYITLRLACPAHRSTQEIFEFAREARQLIKRNGRFDLLATFGADQYATSYAVTLAGIFTEPGHVRGTASGSENSRTLGFCRARHIHYAIHD